MRCWPKKIAMSWGGHDLHMGEEVEETTCHFWLALKKSHDPRKILKTCTSFWRTWWCLMHPTKVSVCTSIFKYIDIQAWTPEATRSLKKRIVNCLCRFLVGGINNSGELQGDWNPTKVKVYRDPLAETLKKPGTLTFCSLDWLLRSDPKLFITLEVWGVCSDV